VYDDAGDGLGVVLVGGAAAGAWSLRGTARTIEVGLELFDAPGPALTAAITERFGAVGALLGAKQVTFAGDGPVRRRFAPRTRGASAG
jgi:hypothetical protein